jgi:membrane-bound ClpP family serine protease
VSLALAIGLLGLGLAFIVAEVLFPSLGVLTLLASVCVIGSLAVAFGISTDTGVSFLVAVAAAVPAAIVLGLKVFPRSPLGKRMVAAGLSFGSTRATDARDVSLEGKRGVVESSLRPTGIARFEGRRVDVVTRGEMIESGAPVRVVEVRGNRVVVARAAEPAEPSAQQSPPAGTETA